MSDVGHGSVSDGGVSHSSVADEPVNLPASDLEVIHSGYIMDLVSQEVDLGEAGTVRREFLRHPGAVAIVAVDDDGRVLLLRQYRLPVRSYLWEVPAGLLDVQGEDLVSAASRELAEEADLTASTWHTLVDYYTSPGGSDEAVRIFLARGLGEVPPEQRHEREAEELGMQPHWLPLSQAVDAVLAGDIHNPSTVAGILAAQHASTKAYEGLRAADAAFVPRR